MLYALERQPDPPAIWVKEPNLLQVRWGETTPLRGALLQVLPPAYPPIDIPCSPQVAPCTRSAFRDIMISPKLSRFERTSDFISEQHLDRALKRARMNPTGSITWQC